MDKDAFLNRLNFEFDNLVEDFISLNETGFKKYAKENLNPIIHLGLVSEFSLPKIIKALNEGVIGPNIKFEGSSDSADDQLKYKKWSAKLTKLFLNNITEAIFNNPDFSASSKKLITEKSLDLFSEIAFQEPPESRDTINDISQYLNTKSNNAKEKLPKSLYYWEYESAKLSKLYDLLLEKDLIEPNKNFIESFRYFEIKPDDRTTWKKEPHNQTSLFALLYLIYGKQKNFRNESVGFIAHKLFKLNNIKFSKNNINAAFSQFVTRDKKAYFTKNHSQIEDIISLLNLHI